MRYLMFCKLKGDIEKYHRNLVNMAAKKFDLIVTKEENLPTHFTLKYWFEAENINELELLIENFCETRVKTSVKVGGFGSFPPNVVFINVQLSDEAKEVFFEFISELRKLSWMSWNKWDAENLRFHTSIAEDCDEKYSRVWQFLHGNEKCFDCWFDNITILKERSRENGILKWEIYKTHWI